MKVSQLEHRCILSALLFLALVWFYSTLRTYLQSNSRSQIIRLLLGICVLSGVLDLALLVLNEFQVKGKLCFSD